MPKTWANGRRRWIESIATRHDCSFQAVYRWMQKYEKRGIAGIVHTHSPHATAFAQERNQAYVQVFFIRGGKLVGRESFVLEGTQSESPSDIMTSFVKQFYSSATQTPPVWMPTMTVLGASVGAIASASCAIRVLASGNEACIEKSLQDELRGDRIGQRLVFLAVNAAFVKFGFGRRAGVALIHQEHRQLEVRF